MRKNNVNMISGPLAKNIIAFAIPVILGGWMQLFFNAADTIVIGQFCGSASVGAMGATGSISALIVNLFMGLSSGVSVAVANAAGSRDHDSIQKAVHTAVLTAMIGGVVVASLGVPLAKDLLRLMDTPESVIDKSALYMRIILAGNIFSMMYNFGAAIMRASGDSRRPLYFISFSGMINVLLNLFFVLVLHLDVAGVALATVIANAISAFLVLRSLSHRTDAFRFSILNLRIHKEVFLKILRIGVPSGIQGSMFAISNVIIQSSVNSFGEALVAGNTANANINGFMANATAGFAVASLNFTGQNVGARQYKRIRKVIINCMCIAAGLGLVLGAATQLFARPLLGLYITDSPQALEYGVLRSWYTSVPYVFYAVYEVFSASIRGLGKSTTSMIVSLGGIGVTRVIWIYTVFAHWRTPGVLYLSFPVSWLLTALLMGMFLLRALRKVPNVDEPLPEHNM